MNYTQAKYKLKRNKALLSIFEEDSPLLTVGGTRGRHPPRYVLHQGLSQCMRPSQAGLTCSVSAMCCVHHTNIPIFPKSGSDFLSYSESVKLTIFPIVKLGSLRLVLFKNYNKYDNFYNKFLIKI